MGHNHSFPHLDSGQVRASPAGSTTTFVDSALTSTEELGLSRFSQPVKQNSQTVTQNGDSLKDEYEFDSELFTHDYYEYEQGQKHILVRGRLKRNINFWRDIGGSDFILDAIVNGYKVPLYSLPPQSFSHNNRSASAEYDFVSEAIKDLLDRSLIEKCESPPRVVNPLTVSVQSSGKKRLILD